VPWWRPTLTRVLDAARDAAPTYDGPRVAALDVAPDGFHLVRADTAVGHGREDLERASRGLRTWATHRVRGVHLLPKGAEVAEGATVLVTFGTPVGAIAAPCRVTSVGGGPVHWGFAYRTLPGHPEVGEESFEVALGEDDVVTLRIRAVSRHAEGPLSHVGQLGRLVQRRVTRAYGRALAAAVAAAR
jgi:uncharacterized protein (UPF0548 family)